MYTILVLSENYISKKTIFLRVVNIFEIYFILIIFLGCNNHSPRN